LVFSIWYFISGAGIDVTPTVYATFLGTVLFVFILTKTHWSSFVSILALLFIGDVLKKNGLDEMAVVLNIMAFMALIGECFGTVETNVTRHV